MAIGYKIRRGLVGSMFGQRWGWYAFEFKPPPPWYEFDQEGSQGPDMMAWVDDSFDAVIARVNADADRFDAIHDTFLDLSHYDFEVLLARELHPDGSPDWSDAPRFNIHQDYREGIEATRREAKSRVRAIVENDMASLAEVEHFPKYQAIFAEILGMTIRVRTDDLTRLGHDFADQATAYFERAETRRVNAVERKKEDTRHRHAQEREAAGKAFAARMKAAKAAKAAARKAAAEAAAREAMALESKRKAQADKRRAARAQAKRDQEMAAKIIAEAEAQASRTVDSAKRKAARILQNAEAQAAEILQAATRSAAAIKGAATRKAGKGRKK